MNHFTLIQLALAAAIAIPAIAQNQHSRNSAGTGAVGNPAQYTNNNGTLVYTPYQGYGGAPVAMTPFGTYDPAADPFYDAHAACNSAVMQQNGWTVVRQTAPNRCDWQKPKTSNPQYVEWLRRNQQRYAEMEQRAANAANRQDVPITKVAQPPTYRQPPPAPAPQPSLSQRLGTPSWMPVPNVPANAVPGWFPTWQQYQSNTNPRGGLNELGRGR